MIENGALLAIGGGFSGITAAVEAAEAGYERNKEEELQVWPNK